MSDPRRMSSLLPLDEHGDSATGLADGLALDDSPQVDRRASPTLFRLEEFSVQIHRSLNPRVVASTAVQELRPICGCERICILERRGGRFRLLSASDQSVHPPRSRQALLLERIAQAVLPAGGRFQFPNERLTLPDEIARLLADYWERSNGQFILIEPVYSEVSTPDDDHPKTDERAVVGALVLEQFSRSDLPGGAIECLDCAIPHLTSALANARKYLRLASVPGLSPLGAIFDAIRRTRSSAMTAYLIVGLCVLACGWFIKRPFEIECRGRLMPTLKREVFAALEGEIIEVLVNDSDRVEQGQIVARVQSRQLEKTSLEQTGLLKGKLKARDAARAELRSRSTPQIRGQSLRGQAQVELINSEIETIHERLELLAQEQDQLDIRAPISGTIATDRPHEKLLGRPVQRGESLLEIMDEAGGWQLELAVPELQIGHLLMYQHNHADVRVRFRLLSCVERSFECAVTRTGDRTLPAADSGPYHPVFCDATRVDRLQRQIGAEVSAKIQCGQRSLFFIWFHEFWELMQRHWWV